MTDTPTQTQVTPGTEILAAAAEAPPEPHGHGSRTGWLLALGSLGVVYGDIGTSPLYALRESLLHAGAPSREEVIGIVSLLIWSLIVVVTIKYVFLLLRADNRGEGGTLALMALAKSFASGWGRPYVLTLGILGAALFYGDAILTPAISMLSAVEGLKVVSPTLHEYVIPITLLLLVGLYVVQSFGTGRVAALFGPIMLLWFATLTVLGLSHIWDAPGVIHALNPYHAIYFLLTHGVLGLGVLGSVFLAVTGAEALYGDMGHFGRQPIRTAWLCVVFPALVINYLGQGAMAIADPTAVDNLFFSSFPSWAQFPMVLLATMATAIAGQAVISGAYSVTRQAIQLGLLPRLAILHTSETHLGQVYMPKVNWLMLAGAILLVVLFQSSGALAAAYGIAVTGEMVVTSLLAIIVVARLWRWGYARAIMLMVPFLVVDTTFLGANLLKLLDGGYIPIVIVTMAAIGMWTWVRGTAIVAEKVRRASVPLNDLIHSLEKSSAKRVTGTAIFLSSDPETAPAALLHNLKHNKVLHEKNIILTVRTESQPYMDEAERLTFEKMSDDFSRLEITYGFMETPNVPKALALAKAKRGLKFDIMATSFFIGRRSLRRAEKGGEMPSWQDRLYIMLTKQANDLIEYFHIPAGRVIELGSQVVL